MNNLELNELNLKELSSEELEEVNGGFFAALICGIAVGLALAAWITGANKD